MEPLRILHIIPNLKRGGAERLVLDIVNGLGYREGIEAALLTLDDKNEYPELSKEIQLLNTNSWYKPSLWRSNSFDLKDIEDTISNFGPTLIHTHLFQADFLVRMSVGNHYPIITHFHDNMPQYKGLSASTLRQKKSLTNYYERLLIQKSLNKPGHRFIAISKHTEAYLQKVLRKHRNRIRLLFNAIDLKRFHPSSQQSLEDSNIQLINIGSFVPKKNQLFLIEVMEHLPAHYRLLLVGDGTDRGSLEELVKRKGLSQRIRFKGIVHNPEDYLRDATLYVHSATYEPFGLVIVEAMATGLPVVALDGGGNRDIIKDGENGFILSAADPEEFAQKIKQLAEDKSLYRKLQKGAWQTAQRFGMESYVDRLLDIYREAIAEATAPQNAYN